MISDYHRGFSRLIVPLTLMNYQVREHEIGYLGEQIYLQAHPKELIVKNDA